MPLAWVTVAGDLQRPNIIPGYIMGYETERTLTAWIAAV